MVEPFLSCTEFFGNNSKKNDTILVTHGLFGSKRNWFGTAKILSERLNRHIVTIDLRNHGSSFWSENHDYQSLGRDLIRIANHFQPPVDMIGHSMGGKAAMSASLLSPEKFNKLIVVDIGPVTYSNSEFGSYISALRQLDLPNIRNRKQADQLLETKIRDQNIRSFLLQNMFRKKNGTFEWRVNLQSLEKNLGEIVSFPKYSSQFLGQTLFIKGQRSSYVSKKSIDRMNKYFPRNKIEEIFQAGHWPHIDQPEAFQDELVGFLRPS